MRIALTLLALLVILAPGDSRAEIQRKVTIAWRPVDQSVHYDFELSTRPDMDPLLVRKDSKASSLAFMLKQGTYYFRVRGIDSNQEPGPWSDVEAFVVNPAPPRPVGPAPRAVFSDPKVKDDGIRFEWKKGISGSKYLLQVKDKNGWVVKRSVDGTDFKWIPTQPGNYEWRVGFETPVGDDWGAFRPFTITPQAFPKPKPQIVRVPEIIHDNLVDEDVQVVKERKRVERVEKGRKVESEEVVDVKVSPAQLWLIARGAQAVLAYTSNDVDLGKSAAGAALVWQASAELRWKLKKDFDTPWTISGSFNLEMIHQQVLNETFSLPRAYARVFATYGNGIHRVGPLLEVGAGDGEIFIVKDATHATEAKVLRKSAGAGAVAVVMASPKVQLSALAVLRLDTGGEAAEIPNPLASSLGYELGFGVVYDFSPTVMLEGRLRGLESAYRWVPAKGGSELSYMNNTLVILDLGLGYRF